MLRCGLRRGLGLAAALGALWGQQAATAQPALQRTSPAVHVHAAKGDLSLVRASKAPKAAAARTLEEIPPLPQRKSVPPPDVWTQEEIDAALARCAKVLDKIEAVTLPQPPIKEGQCGAPAPVRLVSIGKAPAVTFSPPALLNCNMVAALHDWIDKDLQPLAVKHLGAKIVKVEVMGDYTCRTAFGRVGNKLSQHAYADALDIRGFVTESGQTAHVLSSWGLTQHEIAAAQAAAAKAEAERQAAARAAPDKDDKDARKHAKLARHDGQRLDPAAARLGGPRSTPADGKDGGAKVAALGGTAPAAPPPGPQSRFLRAAHAAACRIFGTTLGPEANEAHRNHFHVDMAERKYRKICD